MVIFSQQKTLRFRWISTFIVPQLFGPGKKLNLTSQQISNKPNLYSDPVGSPVVSCSLLCHGLKYESGCCDPKQAICMHELTWTSLFFGHFGQNNAAPVPLSGTWSRRAKSSKNTIVEVSIWTWLDLRTCNIQMKLYWVIMMTFHNSRPIAFGFLEIYLSILGRIRIVSRQASQKGAAQHTLQQYIMLVHVFEIYDLPLTTYYWYYTLKARLVVSKG